MFVMAVKTRPVRIFEGDLPPIRLLAELQGGTPADVIHLAVAEYLHRHREQFAGVFTQSQKALASGDLDAVSQLLKAGVPKLADDLAADLERYR